MNKYNIVLNKSIENGMSCFEVLQHKINSLEKAAQAKYAEYDETIHDIEQLKVRLKCWNISIRERLTIEGDIEMLRSRADRVFRDYMHLTDECRGMRKSVDTIIFINNYGGEVTQQNRQQIEQILNI